MLTGVYATLRSAGRELVLEIDERPSLTDAVARLEDAARCLAEDEAATDAQPLTDPDGSNSDIRLFNHIASLQHGG